MCLFAVNAKGAGASRLPQARQEQGPASHNAR